MSLEVHWIVHPAAFTALQPEWDRLADRARSPFLTHAWFSAWYEAFAADRSLRVCIARRDRELVGVLPLVARGAVLASATNAHTPVFHACGDDDGVRAVTEAAVAAAGGSLVVTHLPADHPTTGILADASRRAGRLTWIEPGQRSPVVETTAGLEPYLRNWPRNMRRDLARRRRKLAAEHAADVVLIAEPVQLQLELQECLELEAAGWKGRRGTAILSSSDTARFYRRVAEAFARRGELRLSTISIDGRPIVFDFCVVSSGRLWIPKGAYDETYRRYSPGLVLLLAEIERAFELGLEAVEILGDDEPYKRPFATSYRAHCAVHSHRRRPVPLARLTYRRAARPLLRSAYRKLRTR
jgi:CelD/BcsL family acetyltransferase involved in cellulose biosynthesis